MRSGTRRTAGAGDTRGRRAAQRGQTQAKWADSDPFAALGLSARPDLTDDDIRAAWRRIAAATHPDRDDGGDPPRFAAAAAAYATLRTSFGRGEERADLRPPAARPAANLAARLSRGHVTGPWPRFALRLLVAAAVCAGSFLAAGWSPGTAGMMAGAVTWLVITRPVPRRP